MGEDLSKQDLEAQMHLGLEVRNPILVVQYLQLQMRVVLCVWLPPRADRKAQGQVVKKNRVALQVEHQEGQQVVQAAAQQVAQSVSQLISGADLL